MDEGVQKLAENSGPLVRILGSRTPEGYESLRLVFERGSLLLTPDADTDEIVVGTEAVVPANEYGAEINDDEVLRPLLGKVIASAWTLTHDRGYTDAFQIRSLDLEKREESCCQFEVSAAAITASRVA